MNLEVYLTSEMMQMWHKVFSILKKVAKYSRLRSLVKLHKMAARERATGFQGEAATGIWGESNKYFSFYETLHINIYIRIVVTISYATTYVLSLF